MDSKVDNSEKPLVTIIDDAESIREALHKKLFSTSSNNSVEIPLQFRSPESSAIIDALKAIYTRLEGFQAAPSGLPNELCENSAVHAARQIAHWASLFISMFDEGNKEESATTLLPLQTQELQQQQPLQAHIQGQQLSLPQQQQQPLQAHIQGQQLPQPLQQQPQRQPIDLDTLKVYRQYGTVHKSAEIWLEALQIPRNIERLQDVKVIWEIGSDNCPPLKEWTRQMRNFKGKNGSCISIYSQRKCIYNIFKEHEFSEQSILSAYGEVKPGKLYKLLNSKKKKSN